MARVLIPIPDRDFDPTEVAVPWRLLSAAGHAVGFATESGRMGEADDIMLSGRGLDPWSAVPGLGRLRLIGRLLGADKRGQEAYRAMAADPAFRAPKRWADVEAADFDALVLPGGHRARGMRAYLESGILQRLVVGTFAAGKPVGAICHGVLLAARSLDPATGRSTLYGRKTTALTWALERAGWSVGRIGRFWDPDYYRTYREAGDEPPGYMSVQAEVTRALADPADFKDVDHGDPLFRRKTSGTVRDTPEDDSVAFVVRDGTYVSARWPGDSHAFAKALIEVLS